MLESKRTKIITTLLVSGCAAAALLLVVWWLAADPWVGLVEFVPGLDQKPESLSTSRGAARIGDIFAQLSDFLPEDLRFETSGNWPRFRGSFFDNINRDPIDLASSWDGETPPIVWSREVGEGHAGPVVQDGLVYLLDYDEDVGADLLRCFSLRDGSELWRRGYEVRIKRNHGMSRSVPAATERWIVTMGPLAHVMCVDAKNGEFLWGIDLMREYDAEVPLWYTAQCPVIDDTAAILAPGGSALMIAVDCATGDVLWETPNPRGWRMSHSSIMPMIYDGVKMYVYCAIGGMVGIAAEGDNAGEILWEAPEMNAAVIAPSPVIFDDGRILATAGYGFGSVMFQISRDGTDFSAEVLYRNEPDEALSCEQQTPILYQGYLFGVLTKDAGTLRNQFVCASPEREMVWTSGKTNRFGLGPYILADGKFYILDDDVVLTVIEATTEGYRELSRTRIFEGRDSWGPFALSDGFLLLRDSTRLVCVDIREDALEARAGRHAGTGLHTRRWM